MRKSIIVAVDQNNGIGYQNQMPWHLPAELKRFRQLTMGHYLIMGRKTFESIGKPLPGRTTIIVTRNPSYQAEGCLVAHSLGGAIQLANTANADEVFVCGGQSIYREALEEAERLYLTRIHADYQTDISFPACDQTAWEEISSEFHPSDEKNPSPFTFFIYDRRS
jgi:dihydrofolate reductase